MHASRTTPSIEVTIGRETRLYHAFITTAPARLDAPAEGGRQADRVLLVAPPSEGANEPRIASFLPVPLPALTPGARLVCSDDDPYCPEGAATLYGEPLGIPVDLLPGGGHLNPDAGYGPWPAVESWCLSAITSSRIAPG